MRFVSVRLEKRHRVFMSYIMSHTVCCNTYCAKLRQWKDLKRREKKKADVTPTRLMQFLQDIGLSPHMVLKIIPLRFECPLICQSLRKVEGAEEDGCEE